MSIYDLVLKSRSYRSYSPDHKVTEAQLRALAECARNCPSAVNKQYLRYRLCCTPADMEKVLPLTKWAGLLPDWQLPPVGHEPPAAIVICHDRTAAASEAASHWDVGITAQTMLLAATEMGLGGCMIGNFVKEKMQAALGLPEHLLPVLVLAVGKPDEEIILEPLTEEGGSTAYYRDADGRHHVPKRRLEDVIV